MTTEKTWADYAAMYMDKEAGIVREPVVEEPVVTEDAVDLNEEAELDEELIAELSKKTLASYASKAVADSSNKASESGRLGLASLISPNRASSDSMRLDKDALDKKVSKRATGINTAVKKLAKEEFDVELDEELIAEISRDMLQSYKHKAARQIKNNSKRIDSEIADGIRAKEAGDDADSHKKYSSAANRLNQNRKRRAGIQTAMKKLAKEETISELSTNTLRSYYDKAEADKDKSGSEAETARVKGQHDYRKYLLKRKENRKAGLDRADTELSSRGERR